MTFRGLIDLALRFIKVKVEPVHKVHQEMQGHSLNWNQSHHGKLGTLRHTSSMHLTNEGRGSRGKNCGISCSSGAGEPWTAMSVCVTSYRSTVSSSPAKARVGWSLWRVLWILGFFGGFHSSSGLPDRKAHQRSRSFLSGMVLRLILSGTYSTCIVGWLKFWRNLEYEIYYGRGTDLAEIGKVWLVYSPPFKSW